jgi:hypothetical protein
LLFIYSNPSCFPLLLCSLLICHPSFCFTLYVLLFSYFLPFLTILLPPVWRMALAGWGSILLQYKE